MKNFGDLMKQAQKMQRKVSELQSELDAERFESSAGGGVVKAVVDGRQRLKKLEISTEVFQEGDAQLLEDLVITAVGEAQRASEARMNERMGSITGGLGLPF